MSGEIRSQRVEFIRFGKLDKGILREGDLYVVSQDSEPVYPFVMTLDHDDYLDAVTALSYKGGAEQREAALMRISGAVTAMLKSTELVPPAGGEAIQLDLVVNAAELGALQFEALLAPDGEHLLGREDYAVTLTRRVRGAFAERRPAWPVTPRVLFAWASPPAVGSDVPHERHAAIIRDSLDPWIGPAEGDENKVLTVLGKAALPRLHDELAVAAAHGRPFSHVHLLAHGYPLNARSHREYFGVALHAADDDDELAVVAPDELVDALSPLRGTSAMVTLATCDSGREANTLIAEKSIAHQLHVSGVPVVVASQLPLTKAGSNLLIEHLYPAVLEGDDVRHALHRARRELRRNIDIAHHDWMSVVAYASLPEGYGDILLTVRLQRTLAALKTAQQWSDDLVVRRETDRAAFDRVEDRLVKAIVGLEAHVARTRHADRAALEENLGLLGSAEKRLAELCFRRDCIDPSNGWDEKMHSALDRSFGWYAQAAAGGGTPHWTAVQALSLEAVRTGRIAAPGRWYAAVQSAEDATARADEYWAFGSLAELYLLAPLAGIPERQADASVALETMKERLGARGDPDRDFARETTARQLRRYVDWWTQANKFDVDLAAAARDLAAALD